MTTSPDSAPRRGRRSASRSGAVFRAAGVTLVALFALRATALADPPMPAAPARAEVTPHDGSGARPEPASDASEAPWQATLDEAMALYENGEPEEAGALVEQYLAQRPQDAVLAVFYERALAERGDFDAAIEFLRQHLRSHPTDSDAAFELGALLLARLEHGEAARVLERIPWTPDMTSHLARLNLGKAYRALGRFEEAQRAYESVDAGAIAPFAEGALCEIELATGRADQCEARIDAAREAGQPHPAFLQAEAIGAYLRGRVDRAAEIVSQLEQTGEPSSRVTALEVLVPLARGDLAAADSALRRRREQTVLGEQNALAAVVAQRAGHPEQARELLRSAVEANPLFADPDRAGRILFWRPEVSATLNTIAGDGTPTRDADAARPEPPSDRTAEGDEGCCSTVQRAPPHAPTTSIVLALLAAALARRRRRARSGRIPSRKARIDLPS